MFAWIAGICAVVCLVYYMVIVLYAGFSVSFSWFWLAAAGALGVMSWGSRYVRLHPKRIPMWVTVPVFTCFVAALVIICVTEVVIFVGATSSEAPGLDYVIVLGARVREEGISNSLKKRLDKAVEYSRSSPGTVFILSGGQGADEPMTEAQAMYDYLTRHGVPASRLVLEPVSTSTVENIAYSKAAIERQEQMKREMAETGRYDVPPGRYLQVEERPVQVGVLTNSFHVFRACRIAQKRGLADVQGIAAGSDIVLLPHMYIRECMAILKDRLVGHM